MKNLQMLANRAMYELDAIGVPYEYVEAFEINTRAKSRWGQCRLVEDGVYRININVELLQDDIDDYGVMNTLIHELIHTCPNCMNHGKEWQMWAELVNKTYSYNIKRTSTASEKGVDVDKHRQRRYVADKWAIKCFNCDRQWKYKRKPTRFDIDNRGYLYNATCPCGCRDGLKLIKL